MRSSFEVAGYGRTGGGGAGEEGGEDGVRERDLGQK